MNKIDFILLFDALDANPNGDPDADNMPRLDGETLQGLVTDVCLKRKIRDYVHTVRREATKYRIYVRSREDKVLNEVNEEAYVALKLDIEEYKKGGKKNKAAKSKEAKGVRKWMCDNFYDIRTFGAVMSTDVNCGQVRGPVQLSFSRSIDPVVTSEFTITRCAVTSENDRQKENTMGRKYTVPYGLYMAKGTINPFLAEQTGFNEEDLQLLIEALTHLFDFDASAARPAGSMAVRKLILFRHESMLGNAPAHKLHESLTITRKPGVEVARSFADYEVELAPVPAGVTVEDVPC